MSFYARPLAVASLSALTFALACAPPAAESEPGRATTALWNSLFRVAPTTEALTLTGRDLQTTSMGETDGDAEALQDGGLTWLRPERTGRFFTACAPSIMPGVDPLDLMSNHTAGILGANLSMNITLAPDAGVAPETPVMVLETGHYVYGDLGDVTWHSDAISRSWSVREITSGVSAEYGFDRGAAWAAAHGLRGENCGVVSCADQDLPGAPFADHKTCVRLTFPPGPDGGALVATATLAEITLDYRAWGFEPNFPRDVTLEFSCSSFVCSVDPAWVAPPEPGETDRLEYLFIPRSAPAGVLAAVAWYSMDGGVTKTRVELSDPAVYDTPIRALGSSGLMLGAHDAQRLTSHERSFTFELIGVAPPLETFLVWRGRAEELEQRLDDNVRSFVDIRNLANQLIQLFRQAQISLNAIETLLVSSSGQEGARVADLYFATGPRAGASRTGADLPAWFTAAAAEPSHLVFRRLASIRAQLVAGQAVTGDDRRSAIDDAGRAVRDARDRLEQALDDSDALLATLVRWSRALQDAQRELRDCLLLKARQGRAGAFNGWSGRKCAPAATLSP